MCLSTVYNISPRPENALMRNVQRIEIDGGDVVCFDVMERRTAFTGKLIMADLVEGRVIIQLEE